jgi:hypothetical protein
MHTRESTLRTSGPNGSFRFGYLSSEEMLLLRLPLSFDHIRELHIRDSRRETRLCLWIFPALEALAIERDESPQESLSYLLSYPETCPSLKTLAFLNCDLSESFMERLARFAFIRKNTASVELGRVVITHHDWEPPYVESIRAVERHVPVVDVQPGEGIPEGLEWCREGDD